MKKFFMAVFSIVSVFASLSFVCGCNESSSDNTDTNNKPNTEIVTPKPDNSDKDKPVTLPVEDTKEFDEAVKKVEGFIEKMKISQNFTQSLKLANDVTTVIKFDREVCEVTADNVNTFYSPMQDGKLYKIAKDSEDKWRKSECENAPYTVSDIVTVLENSEWESFDNSKLTGKTVYNEQNATILVRLTSGTFEYTLSNSENNTTGSIYNVENTFVTIPEVEPEKPPVDYDNLTAADLTAEQKATIANNVAIALATNIKNFIGRNIPIKKVMGIDFADNKLTLLLNFDINTKSYFGLYEFTLTSNVSYKSFLTNDITPATNGGTRIVEFSYTNNNEKTDAVFNKLYQDKVIDENGGYDLQDFQDCGATVTENHINLYRINKHQIINVSLQVRSDGNTKDYITDNLINGTLNGSNGYRINEIKTYKFTNNALYDFNGLEKAS